MWGDHTHLVVGEGLALDEGFEGGLDGVHIPYFQREGAEGLRSLRAV